MRRVPHIMKNCPNVVFDSSKEASWCTECKSKNPSSLQSMVSEKKSRKSSKNTHFNQNSQNLQFFKGFSWFDQKPYSVMCWGLLHCIQWSGRFFWAIKNSFWTIFQIFHHHHHKSAFLSSGQLRTLLKIYMN